MPSSKKKGSGGKKMSASNKATSDAINAKIEALAAGASASQPLPNVDSLATAGAAAIRKILSASKDDAAAAEGEDRLEAVQQEYRRLADAAKRVEADRKAQVARAADRDRIASELTRTREVKERLEVLCRELQKQSKDVAEGAQKQRDALNEKFQSSIDDIQKKLEEQAAVQLDNQTLRKKLELIEKQSEIREQQYAAETRHKELEMELCTTQLAQATAQVRSNPTPPCVPPGSRRCPSCVTRHLRCSFKRLRPIGRLWRRMNWSCGNRCAAASLAALRR